MYKLANIVTGSVVAGLILTVAVVFIAAIGDYGPAMKIADMADGERPWTAARMVDVRDIADPLTDALQEPAAIPVVTERGQEALAE